MSRDPVAQQLLDEAHALRTDRAAFDVGFDLIRRRIWPSAAEFSGASQPGSPVYTEMPDTAGEDAAEFAAAGLQAMLTNEALHWVDLELMDTMGVDKDASRIWLSEASNGLLKMFSNPATKFYSSSGTSYGEAVGLGNWCEFTEDRPGRLPLFKPVSIANVWWEENEDGDPDCFYRMFSLTAWAAHRRWGDRLPKAILDACNSSHERNKRFTFWHVVKPREYGKAGAAANRKPYASWWVCEDEACLLGEGGYEEQPYIAGRWNLRPGEAYGRGPGHKALGVVGTLNRVVLATMGAMEKAIDPPLFVPDDGVVGPLSLRRSAINWIRAEYLREGYGPRALNLGTQPQLGVEYEEALRVQIRRKFMHELLTMIRDPRATATHVLELKEEQSRGMVPIVSRIEAETVGRKVSRAFAIAQRAGLLMPPPPGLIGRAVRPHFQSPAVKAQRMAAARGIAQLFDAITPMLQLDQAPADNIDLDEAVRDIAETVGVPAKVLRPIAQVAEMRRARQQTSEQREERETIKDVTTGAKNLAPMLRVLQGGQEQAA